MFDKFIIIWKFVIILEQIKILHVFCCFLCGFFTYIYVDGNGNMFWCQIYKCTINANKEWEASLLKKEEKKEINVFLFFDNSYV